MECFCNLDLAPETTSTPLHSSYASHSGSCDAFNLLKHPWETSSAVALSSFFPSTAAVSKTCASPQPKDFDFTLPHATPSSKLFSLSSSFLPAPASPINAFSSSLLPPPPPPPALSSQSLLETARNLPSDAAAYRVRACLNCNAFTRT